MKENEWVARMFGPYVGAVYRRGYRLGLSQCSDRTAGATVPPQSPAK